MMMYVEQKYYQVEINQSMFTCLSTAEIDLVIDLILINNQTIYHIFYLN